MDGKLVALWPVSTDTSRLRQDVNVVLCQDASENESTNYLCKTKPVAESSLQELKSSSAKVRRTTPATPGLRSPSFNVTSPLSSQKVSRCITVGEHIFRSPGYSSQVVKTPSIEPDGQPMGNYHSSDLSETGSSVPH
ncbi:hypothetical protein Pcinc_007468 [Petrolisthes cinctipes]|uniref:Uncharacterized protein n=1 Tax=Petrolisthes cinctipes TaxID=88211 RepID=A0AAE1KWV9_PETCI|nr:hypothetical protein Pcinc_007468 [Petrolisthes cinctipes]